MAISTRTQQVQQFFESMSRLQRVLDTVGAEFFQEGMLSRPQIVLLYFLSTNTDCTIKDIAKMMNVSSSAATQMVQALVKRGLVSRAVDPGDKRVVKVRLSVKGSQQFEYYKKKHLEYMEQLFEGLDDKEMGMLASLPEKIAQHVGVIKEKGI